MPLTNQEAVLQLLDLPYAHDRLIVEARSNGKKTATLDYMGTGRPDLNIAIVERDIPAGEHLFGLKYAIIRSDVLALAPHFVGDGVVIMIGGSDILGHGYRAAAQLHRQGLAVTQIIGPLGKASPDPPAWQTAQNPNDLAKRLATCDWALSNGGGSMFELMCLGKAIHVLPQTDAEKRLAEMVLAHGGVLGIGLDQLSVPTEPQKHMVANRAHQLIDGRGLDRIVAAIERLGA